MTDQAITNTSVPSHRDGRAAAGICDVCGRTGAETQVITAEFRRRVAPAKINPFLSMRDLSACGQNLPRRERCLRLCWLFRNIANDWNICERCVDHMAATRDRYASDEEDAGSDEEGRAPFTAYGYGGGDE